MIYFETQVAQLETNINDLNRNIADREEEINLKNDEVRNCLFKTLNATGFFLYIQEHLKSTLKYPGMTI